MKLTATILLAIVCAAPTPAAPTTRRSLDSGRVLLLPFMPLEGSPARDSIGRGVQRSLEAELARSGSIQPITLAADKLENASPVGGYATAEVLKLARGESARYAIHGTYQLVDQELRILGLVVDVETGRAIGSLKATASARDLFEIEDSLSSQAARLLRPAISPPRVAATFDLPTGVVAKRPPAEAGPIANPYALHDEDPAVRQSRQRLQSSIEYVYPAWGCYGSYGGYGYYGNYSYFGFGPAYGYRWGR